jgi:phosphomannomutase
MLEGWTASIPSRWPACAIGWDAGNGAAGPALERLVHRLPGEHFCLYTEVDGHFPNHHPRSD